MDKLKMEMDKLSKLETYSIVLGSLLLALVLFLSGLFLRSRRSQTGSVILLVGPSDGGKTAIFSSLIYNHAPQTHTSLQPNAAMYKPPSPFHRHPLQLVDIPGHPRIRGQFIDYLQGTSKPSSNFSAKGVKGIVFVCDGAALTRNASNVAEHLVLVMKSLASLPPSQATPPLLIWANKSDLLPSAPSAATGAKVPNTQLALTRTTTILERELEKRRLSSLKSGAALNDLGDSEEAGLEGVLDVSDGGEFKFEKWDGQVEIKAGWVDVKKGKASSPLGETDDESEHETEKKDAGAEKESLERKTDGLAELVDWIAGLP